MTKESNQDLTKEKRSALLVIKANKQVAGLLKLQVGCFTPVMICVDYLLLRYQLLQSEDAIEAVMQAKNDLTTKNKLAATVITDQSTIIDELTKSHPKVVIDFDQKQVDLSDMLFARDQTEINILANAINKALTKESHKYDIGYLMMPDTLNLKEMPFDIATNLGINLMQNFAKQSPQLICLSDKKHYAYFKNAWFC